MSFELKIEEKIKSIESQLEKYLSVEYPEIIYETMRYSTLSAGKRMRGILCMTFCEAFGGNIDDAVPFAAALEMIHAYSLIHDDLPALDNDDLRRGKPSCHIKYGEAMAILAGDALLNEAFEIMSAECVNKGKRAAEAMSVIAAASGTRGMIGGQVADIIYVNKTIDLDTLLYIHKNKTAALIKSAVISGAIIAGVGDKRILERLGEKLGLAFQIKDDILDVTGDSSLLGKPTGSDEKNNKTTYVTLKGIEKAQTDFKSISADVFEEYNKLDINSVFLEEYLDFLVNREF